MYITQANLNRLFDSISCNEVRLHELLHSNPLLLKMLSEPELMQLTAIEGVMTGNSQLNILRIEGVRAYTNSDNYVFNQNIKPCYHATNTCSRLENDWINILIPEKIRNLGSDEVERYRRLFTPISADDDNETRLKKLQINISVVQAHYIAKGIELDAREIHNIVRREHTSIVAITSAIDLNQKINEYKDFLHYIENDKYLKNVYNSRYVSNQYLKSLFKNKSDNEKIHIEKMQKFRKEILELSISQLMITHNFNSNNLNSNILDKLGFESCKNCLPKQANARIS